MDVNQWLFYLRNCSFLVLSKWTNITSIYANYLERSRKSHVPSATIGWAAAAHMFSPLGYPRGIEADLFQKTNTFSNRRKEVIQLRYFALKNPRLHGDVQPPPARNVRLSLKSKGLLSMMLSLPEDWNYTTRGLAKICKEGTDSIGSAMKELERAEYIVRNRLRDSNGKIIDVEYVIYETPHPPDTGQPCEDEPDMDNPCLENRPQLNKEKRNSEEQNTDSSSTEGSNPIQSSPQTPAGAKRTGLDA